MDKSQLETSIDILANDFASGLAGLATGDFLREGVVKQGITSLVWAVYHAMPDQRAALGEALENWPEIIQDAIASDRREQGPTP